MFSAVKFIFVLLIGCSTSIFAQDLKGVVRDLNSQLPIANAKIIMAKATILTNDNGQFVVASFKPGDFIAIRIFGYETIELKVNKLTDTLRIYLKQDPIALQEVMIKGKRNYKLDSLTLRSEYASAFAYKGPSISDMFIGRDPNYDSPFAFTNPKSTASLVSLNLLQVASLFGKKKVQKSRLKQTLIRDEQLNYSDEVFSKDKVKSITGLEDEALLKFMNHYRPGTPTLKKMTAYELTIYIKKSYQEFLKAKP